MLVPLFAVFSVAVSGCSSGTHGNGVTAFGGAGGSHPAPVSHDPEGANSDEAGWGGELSGAGGATESAAGAAEAPSDAPAAGAPDAAGGRSMSDRTDGRGAGGAAPALGGATSRGGDDASNGGAPESRGGAGTDDESRAGAASGAADARGGASNATDPRGGAAGAEVNGGAPPADASDGGANTTSTGSDGGIGDPVDPLPLPDPGPGPLYLPCDVVRALSVCRNCHSNPPIHDTQYSLVNYYDVKPLAPAIYDDLESGNMPRPPFSLAAAQKAILLDWLGTQGSAAPAVSEPCQ